MSESFIAFRHFFGLGGRSEQLCLALKMIWLAVVYVIYVYV